MYTTLKRIMPTVALLLLLAVPILAGIPGMALRLHVVANSDSARDQALKHAVRDAVLTQMRPALDGAKDKAGARMLLLNNAEALQSAADGVLEASGVSYGARLYYGDYTFPDRLYGETVYPAGEYEALRIVLGSGQGQNWWCVMFPPLCLVDLEGATTPTPGEGIKFESAIAKLFG